MLSDLGAGATRGSGRAKRVQILQCFFERYHIRVFGIQVKKALLMSCLRAVAHGFTHDHWTETSLARVDRGSAHAATRRASCDDQRIDPANQEARNEIGSKKAGCILFDQ